MNVLPYILDIILAYLVVSLVANCCVLYCEKTHFTVFNTSPTRVLAIIIITFKKKSVLVQSGCLIIICQFKLKIKQC